jgi:beta-lactamase class D
VITFLLAGLINLSFAQSTNPEVSESLNKFIDQWHRDAAEANLDAYIGAMTPDAVYIGTDATERWTGAEFRDFCKPHFDRKRTWTFRATERNVTLSADGQLAWFDELLDTHMGLCRGSGVLIQSGGEWKIAHYVLSATIPNDQMREVTKHKAKWDSTLIIQHIFDRHKLNGAIVILDPAGDRLFGYNPSKWWEGYLPASTFKIPNSLIGIETGVVDTNYIFRWNGEKRRLPQWEKDMNLKEAFAASCVPCYQELARKIGTERMIGYLNRFGYGEMSVQDSTIDRFWLEGPSKISPDQQLDFLQKLYDETLPLKPETMKIVKEIMVVEKTPEYTLRGKTGWFVRNGNNYGWFIGWVEKRQQVFYFATIVEPKDQNETPDFASARKKITMEVLGFLQIIP